MSNTIFMMMAANVSIAEQPIEGQTGVWLSSGGAAVSSGMSVSGVDIHYNTPVETVNVYGKGLLIGASVGYWGTLYVSSGGSAANTVVYQNGGNAYARVGIMSDTTIVAGRLYVQGGGSAVGVTVSGGSCVVQVGSASAVVVNNGGTLVVSSGGTALAVTSNAGAVVTVAEGGYIEYVTP